MKISSIIVAAIATLALGMGSARADEADGWHMNYTLNTSSQIAAPYTASAARTQAANMPQITASAGRTVYEMTYGNG